MMEKKKGEAESTRREGQGRVPGCRRGGPKELLVTYEARVEQQRVRPGGVLGAQGE